MRSDIVKKGATRCDHRSLLYANGYGPEDLKKPELTAQIEMKLSKIGNGSMKREAFMKEMEQYTKELVSEVYKCF